MNKMKMGVNVKILTLFFQIKKKSNFRILNEFIC